MSPEIASPLPAGSVAGDVSDRAHEAALEGENARLRGDLLTISRRLSHDLRNPLNCISTANQGLRDLSVTPDSPAECFALSISDAVDEAVALVQRLSVFLKATAAPLPVESLPMGGIVAATLQRLEPLISKIGATVALPPRWPAAKGVSAWIDLVWENLLRNSLQHARAETLALELGWDGGGDEHRFWLRDNGRGVPAEKRRRLFHPFDRLHELNAPRGYGLPIIQRLVAMQGGRCGFEPQPGSGACFFFTLPAD
jgi:signal transduction histidine kinase